jgi:hypothetical protein
MALNIHTIGFLRASEPAHDVPQDLERRTSVATVDNV